MCHVADSKIMCSAGENTQLLKCGHWLTFKPWYIHLVIVLGTVFFCNFCTNGSTILRQNVRCAFSQLHRDTFFPTNARACR